MPGAAFRALRYLRVSYASSNKIPTNALDRMASVLAVGWTFRVLQVAGRMLTVLWPVSTIAARCRPLAQSAE